MNHAEGESELLTVFSELFADWCFQPVMNPATSLPQVNRVYRRDGDTAEGDKKGKKKKKSHGEEQQNKEGEGRNREADPQCLDGYPEGQCWMSVLVTPETKNCDWNTKDKSCVVAVTHRAVRRIFRREDEELPVEGDDMPIEVDEISPANEQWLLDHLVDENGIPILESDKHPANASDTPDNKPVFMRPMGRLYKPQETLVALAQMSEPIATYMEPLAETLLPRFWPRPYSHPCPIDVINDPIGGIPIAELTPIVDPNDSEIYLMSERRGLHSEDNVFDPPTVAAATDHFLHPPFAAATSNGHSGSRFQPFPDKVVGNGILDSETHRPAHGVYHREVEPPVTTEGPSPPIAEVVGQISPVVEQFSEGEQTSRSRETQADGSRIDVEDFKPVLLQNWAVYHKPAEGIWRRTDDNEILETDSLMAQSAGARKASLPSVITIHRPAPDIFRRKEHADPAQVDDLKFDLVNEAVPSEHFQTLSDDAGQSKVDGEAEVKGWYQHTHRPVPTLWRRDETTPFLPAEATGLSLFDNLPRPQEPSAEAVKYAPGMADGMTHDRVEGIWRRNDDSDVSDKTGGLLQAWRHNMGHGPVTTDGPFLDLPGPAILRGGEDDVFMEKRDAEAVPPPEFFNDRPWPYGRAAPINDIATNPEDVGDVWSEYETPPILEPAVKHMPILPRQSEDISSHSTSAEGSSPEDALLAVRNSDDIDGGDEEYGKIHGMSIAEYSKLTPAWAMNTVSSVYRRGKDKKKKHNDGQKKDEDPLVKALTHELSMRVDRRQPKSLDFKTLKSTTTANPAKAMHWRTGVWRRDALNLPMGGREVHTNNDQPKSRVWRDARRAVPDTHTGEYVDATSFDTSF
jgi:hypothetical protein